jgi:hypothetical protein
MQEKMKRNPKTLFTLKSYINNNKLFKTNRLVSSLTWKRGSVAGGSVVLAGAAGMLSRYNVNRYSSHRSKP